MKKSLSVILIAALATGVLAGCGSSNGASTSKSGNSSSVVLTYAEVNSNDSLDGQVGTYFKEKVEELSKGTITVDIQASGVLGAEDEILANMTTGGGTVDISRISCSALNNYGSKLTQLLTVPYIFESRDHYWKFTESEIGQKILDEAEDLQLGVKGLFYMEEGFRNFFFKNEVKGIEDLAGKKIRVNSDPIMTGTVDALGASATVVSFNELYSSLQSGVVDGADQPTALYESNAFNEVAPYLIEDNHIMSASEVIISDAAWAKLSDEQKAAVEEAGKDTSKYCKELSAKMEEECKERLEKKGVTFIEVSDKTPWQKACKSVIDKCIKGYESEYEEILNTK